MRKRNLTLAPPLALGSALLVLVAAAVPAHAYNTQNLPPDGAPYGSKKIGMAFEHADGGGHSITWWSKWECTPSTGDTNYREISLLEEQANDQISSFQDFSRCDTNFGWNWNFDGGTQTGYMNGSAITNLSPTWNDQPSSIRWS